MTESMTLDSGNDGLRRAARVFYFVAAFHLMQLAVLDKIAVAFGEWTSIENTAAAFIVLMGCLALVTARGILRRQSWALLLGILQGVFLLFQPVLGTVLGLAVLLYLYRAVRAGLFGDPKTLIQSI